MTCFLLTQSYSIWCYLTYKTMNYKLSCYLVHFFFIIYKNTDSQSLLLFGVFFYFANFI